MEIEVRTVVTSGKLILSDEGYEETFRVFEEFFIFSRVWAMSMCVRVKFYRAAYLRLGTSLYYVMPQLKKM